MKKTAKSFNFRNRRTNKRRIAGAPGHGFALKPIASLLGTLPAGLLLGMHTGAIAGPAGGNIAAGTGTITAPDTTTTVVNQQSHNLTVNWDSFNLATNERVQFKQPSTQSQALNRIFDQNPSQIHGRIDANGKVLLVNPSGIFFGPTARVNAGSLVASGLPVSEQDLNRDKYQFNAPADAEGGVVVNQGMLQAATGGSVNLIGGAVKNEGMILATAGQVNLGAGRRATIDFDGDGLVQFSVDQQILDNAHALDEAVDNSGEINADGGSVLLTAEVAQEVFSHAVNNSGIISAGRIQNEGGQIKLVAAGSGGALINTGTLDASSKDGDGGRIEIDAATGATLADNAAVTATSATDRGGHVQITADTVALIDAATVDVSGDRGGGTALIGGDYQGGNPDVKNAKLTYVGEDATIKADAIRDGDGGRLIVWADERSYYYSRTGSARGGADSGDGGFAEVSGREYLDFQGLVDLRAPEGEAGSLLLDPTDITICDGDVTGCSTGGLTLGAVIRADGMPLPDAANLSDTDLNAQLMMGNVEVNAAMGGASGMGDILVEDVAVVDGSSSVMPGTNNDLTLTAARNITIDGTIQNVENLTFTAGTAAGDITIDGTIQAVENLILNLGMSGTLSGSGRITGTGTPMSSIQGGTNYMVTGANQGNVDGIGFSNVGTLIGNGVGTLTGENAARTWTLDGTPTGNTYSDGTNTLNFGGFATLQGGSDMDMFTLSAASTFDLLGGGGADDFTVNDRLTGRVDGEAGDDTFNVNATLDGMVIGGAGANVYNLNSGGSLTGGIIAGDDNETFNVNAAYTLDLDGLGGDDRFNVNATLGGMVMGGTGTDRLSGTAINDVGLSGFVTNGFAGTEGDITGGFDGIDTLTGTGGTLTGENAARTWTLDGTETGNTYTDGTNTLSFGGFDTLQGGNDNDMFIITADSAFNLRGSAGDDTFDVDAPLTDDPMTTATTGEISGGTGADTLMGDQIDNVILTGSTTAGGFIGTEDSISVVFNGINTLVGTGGTLTGRDLPVGTIPPQVSTWMLDGTPTGNTYNDNSNTLNFGGFATLQGGSGANRFTISAPSTFVLLGGDDEDTFNIASGGRLTGSLDGQGGADRLIGDEIGNVTLTGSDDNGFAGTEDSISGGFNGIDTLTGNGGGTLTGEDAASTWMLDGDPTYRDGTTNTVSGMPNTLNFSGFATLRGGSAADTFEIATGISGITTLDGQGGADRLIGDEIGNVTLTGSDDNGFAGTEDSISGGFNGIDTLTGTGGTLTGENAASTWMLDGDPTYRDGTTNTVSGMPNTLNFSGFATLRGGSAADTFEIATGISGITTLDGQGGADRLIGDEIGNVTLTGSDDNGFAGTEDSISGGFDGIDTLTGTGGTLTGEDAASTWMLDGDPTYRDGTNNTVSGMPNTLNFSGFATLQGGSAADRFEIAAGVSGITTLDGGLSMPNEIQGWTNYIVDGENQGDVIISPSNISFVNVQTLMGSSGADTFNIASGGRLTGSLDGQGGADTLMGDEIGDVTLTGSGDNGFAGTEDSISGGFNGIDTLTGTGGTLTGEDAASTWMLDGDPTYRDGTTNTVSGMPNTLNFSGFATLRGGSAADTFEIATGISGITTLDGGLSMPAMPNEIQGWTNYIVDGENQGDVIISPSNISFVNVQTLMGSSGADTFNIASGGSLTGSLDGQGGADTLMGDEIGNVTLTGSDDNGFAGTEDSISGGFDGIDTLTGTGGTLTGENAASTWMLDGDPTYRDGTTNTVSGMPNTLNFSGFATLRGGSAADTFEIAAGISGITTLDGQGGADRLMGDEIGDVTLTGSGDNGFAGTEDSISGGFDGIDTLTGTGGTLTGEDAASTWMLDGDPTYRDGTNNTVSGMPNTLNFSGFATLQGGSAADTFEIAAGVSGITTLDGGLSMPNEIQGWTNYIVDGENQGDVIISPSNISFVNVQTLMGSSGADTFNIASGGRLTGSLDGQGGADTLMGDEIGDVTLTGSGDNGFAGTEDSISGGFNGIDTLTGTGGTLTGEDAASTWMLDGDPTYRDGTTNTVSGMPNTLNFSGFATLRGGSAADTFEIATGISGITTLDGGLSMPAMPNEIQGWTNYIVDGENQGDVIISPSNISFVNVQTLMGSSGADTFNIASGGSLTGSLDGQGGADTLMGDEIGNVTLTGSDDNGFAGTEDSISGGFDGIDTLTGTGGTLTGENAASTWMLDGDPTYRDGTTNTVSGMPNTLNFSGFATLRGGSAADTFEIAAGISGITTLDGQGGADRLMGDEIGDVTLTGSGDNGFAGTEDSISGGFDGIDTLTGTGGTLTGEDAASTWMLDGDPTYRDGTNNTVSGMPNTLNFSGFATLQGGSAADTFEIAAGVSGITTLDGGLSMPNEIQGWTNYIVDGENQGDVIISPSNISFVNVQTLMGSSGADTFNIASGGRLTGSLDGQGGADTLMGDEIGNVTLTGSGDNGFAGTEDSISGGFDGIDTLTGTGGTLTGEDAASTWMLDGDPTYRDGTNNTVSGMPNTLNFSGFATLRGGSAADTFEIAASISGITTLDGGLSMPAMPNEIQGWTNYIVDGENQGDVIISPSNISFVNVQTLMGSSGADTFNIASGGRLTGSLDGQGGADTLMGDEIGNVTLTGSDDNGFAGTEDSISGGFNGIDTLTGTGGTLTGENAASTWMLDGDPTYRDGTTNTVSGMPNTLNFSGFATLRGGSAADTFEIATGISGITTLDGQGGADRLIGDEIGNVTLTGSDDNGFAGTEDSISGGFDGIDTLTGTGGTLTGEDAASTWMLDGDPTYRDGTNNTVSGLPNTLNFSGFMTLQGGSAADRFEIAAGVSGITMLDGQGGENELQGGTNYIVDGTDQGTVDGISFFNVGTLMGSSDVDTFEIATGGSLTGSLDGLGEADRLMGDEIGNVTLTGSDDNGFAGTEDSISGGFNGIDTLTGTGGTLTGENAASTWMLDGDPTYRDGTTNTVSGMPNTLNFSGFATLQGGSAADTFEIAAGVSGITMLDGQGGENELQGGTNYIVDGTDQGTVDGISFFNVGTLMGSSDVDTFEIASGGRLTGSLDGQGGADTLMGDEIGNVTLTGSDDNGFAGTEDSISGGFNGIDTLTGTGGTLTGENAASTWMLDGDPTYRDGTTNTVSGMPNTLNFSGFATLRGGSAADTFEIATGISGITTLDGQGGADRLIGDEIGNVTLTGSDDNGFAGTEDSISGGFDGIDTLTGTGGTLTGEDAASTWMLDGDPTYRDGTNNTVSGLPNTLNFSGFMTLQGGSAADTFEIAAGVSGITTLDGGLSMPNEIQGWTNYIVDGENQGDVIISPSNISFVNVQTLMGSSGADTFNIASGGRLTGSLDGQGGADTLMGDEIGNVTLTGSDDNGFAGTEDSISGGFDGIDTLTGTGGTLTGEDAASTWMLDGDPTYRDGTTNTVSGLPNTLNFSGFATLQGGSAADTFTISAASAFNLLGGGGADGFTVDAVLTGRVDGEAGDDALDGSLINDVTLTGSDGDGFAGTEVDITVGFDGIDTLTGIGMPLTSLTGQDQMSTWMLDGSPTYDVSGNILNFDGFATLQGGSAADTFTISVASAFNLLGGGGADGFTVDAVLTGRVDGEAGADTLEGSQINDVTLTGSDGDGFAGTDADITGGFDGITTLSVNGGTLTGRDLASTWALDATPTYNDGTNTLNFDGFATLQGGSAADTFTLSAARRFNLLGGDGVDSFTVDARLTGDLDGEVGVDTLEGSQIDAVVLTGSDGDGFAGTDADITGGFDGITTLSVNGGTLTGRNLVSTWELDATPTYDDGSNTLNFNDFAGIVVGLVVGENPSNTFTADNIFTTTADGSFVGTVNLVAGSQNLWDHTAAAPLTTGSVTGTGSLTIPDYERGGEDNTLNIDTTDLILPDLTGFEGQLVIGGTIMDANAVPYFASTTGPIVVNTRTLNLNNPITTGGAVTLLGGNIVLNNGITAGNTMGLVAVAAETEGGNINVATELTLTAPASDERPSGAFIANSIDNAINLILAFDGGEVEIAVGGGRVVQVSGASDSATNREDAAFSDFIESLAGTTMPARISICTSDCSNPTNLQPISVGNLASVEVTQASLIAELIGLESVAFIDIGLFEEELTLYGQIGTGVALALAQCEEEEGCAPNVTEEELNALIARLDEQVFELERRLAEESSANARTKIEELIVAYNSRLESFRGYKRALQEFFAAEEDEFQDEEIEALTQEQVPESVVPGELEKLTKTLEVIKARLEWLQGLQADPDERARLGELTNMDLTPEALDLIIDATRAELRLMEGRLRSLMEGQIETRLDEQPVFVAETRDMSEIQHIQYGPAGLLTAMPMMHDQQWH